MYFQLYLITILVSITYVSSKKSGAGLNPEALELMLASLGGLGGGRGGGSSEGSSGDETDLHELSSREIKKYFDSMAKMEEKFYKKTFRQQISKEEKDELKYFENMLAKVKELNAKL